MPPLAASNPRVRRLRRLLGRRSSRLAEGVFVLEGPTVVTEALAGVPDLEVEAVFIDDAVDAPEVVVSAQRVGVPVHRVAAGVLASLTDVVNPRPVLGVAAIPRSDLSDVVTRAGAEGRHLVVLVDIRDPGNLGTIVRAAEASGAAGVVCTTGTVDPWSPKVVRSSAGAVLWVPTVDGVAADEAFAALDRASVPSFGTVLDGGVAPDEAALDGAVAIVLGNEAHGLDAATLLLVDHRLTIPMEGRSESLNVAMAAAIVSFEALRQRRVRGASGQAVAETDWTPAVADDKVSGR